MITIPVTAKSPDAPALSRTSLQQIGSSVRDSPGEARSSEHSEANSIVDLVESQVARRPDATAIAFGCDVLSYADLDARASELAAALAGLGVGPETVIGLLLPRSPAMVVAALGILKAGAAYLPLDPMYPEARLAFSLKDAQAPILITGHSVKAANAPSVRTTVLLDEWGRLAEVSESSAGTRGKATITPHNLAYVIYTSGSTGRPKGVEITHASLLNLVQWHQRAFQVTENDRASQVARVGFDAAVWEIWPYLTAGASLHPLDEDLLSEPEKLQAWLVTQGITIAFIPTPMAERLLALPWPAKTALRVMLTGGDTLHTYAPEDIPFLLVNNYGPTECTVVATSALVSSRPTNGGLPPIGFPIQNTQVYVLDESGKPVPQGERGELYIGGAGVARGYRNHLDLTAERFVPNPFAAAPGERLYKTGDLVRSLPDGQLAFLGRVDDQIKVRGFRIEPNEVAAALNEFPAVVQSVVVAQEIAGDQRLVAYLVLRSQPPPALSDLHEFLRTRLPDYMVPAVVVVVEHLPLTAHGKVDRAALPVPNSTNTLRDRGFVAPRTDVEKTVADLLQPLLGVERLDVEDNFFALGGHSLLGTQLIARVRQAFGVELALRHVFEAPTVAGIAAEIEQLLSAKLESLSEEQARSLLTSVVLPTEEGRSNGHL